MFWRDEEHAAEEPVVEPDPAEVELEPQAPEPLAALRKIQIKRTGKQMLVSGEHAKILVDARRAEYIG